MLKVDGNNIFLTRGDSATLELSVTQDEETYDFSGDDVVFSVKRFVTDKEAVIKKTFEDGKISFAPEDTADLPFGTYLYDVQLTHTSGEDVTVCTVIVPTTFIIGAEVTTD